MPSTEENLQFWTQYDWVHWGDEWSTEWSGTEFLWWGTLVSRIHAFVPTNTILEIAPGFGRVTYYLKDLCKSLIVVDLTERCIESCKQRFSLCSHITYHVNDGISLKIVPDNSVDFVISFDSLVHAEVDVIEAYLSQLAKKLTPNGVGFIHHSNLGACLTPLGRRLPPFRKILRRGWRAESMTARLFEEYCEKFGLQCLSQELINWNIKYPLPLDCFSVFTKKNSRWARPNRVFKNMRFTHESEYLAELSHFYSTSSFK